MPKLESDFRETYKLYAPSGYTFNEFSEYLLSTKSQKISGGRFYKIYSDLAAQFLWYFSDGFTPNFHEFHTFFLVKTLCMDYQGYLPKNRVDFSSSAGLVKPWVSEYRYGADVETSSFFVEVETSFKHDLGSLFSRLQSYYVSQKNGVIWLLNPSKLSLYSAISSRFPNFAILSGLSLFSYLRDAQKIRVSLDIVKRRFEEETRQSAGHGFSVRKKF